MWNQAAVRQLEEEYLLTCSPEHTFAGTDVVTLSQGTKEFIPDSDMQEEDYYVEVCTSVSAVKYLYKNVYTGVTSVNQDNVVQ